MSERVLVPLDDSPQSWDAFEYALEEFPGAAVVALHVIEPLEALLEGDVYGGEISRSDEEAENVRTEVEAIAAAFDAQVTTVVEEGRAARVIVDYAREHDVDHVVMGSHGRTGASRVLLGSVAETVVRRSPVPVTVVR
jgi:nucleotide-binding universal stress UspA family protein